MYAELMCRTHYSFLKGASSPQEMVQRASELGLSALAITDRNGVYGIPKAVQESRLHRGLKLIVGAELTLENPLVQNSSFILPLLAKNRAGYALLCRLLTASHQKKSEARLLWEPFLELMNRSERSGLVALLPVPGPALPQSRELPYSELKQVFEQNLALALSRVLDGGDSFRTQLALDLKRRHGFPLLATNDVHFHVPQRKRLQDTLTAIGQNCSLDEVGHEVFSNSERYLKSAAQMQILFQDLPEALEQTQKVASQCEFSLSELKYTYPSEWIPQGETAQSYLEKLTWQGAQNRYPCGVPDDVSAQLEHELRLIEQLEFSHYFLTLWEIVEFAQRKKILFQGRGSAANSVVCYCLAITAIDPVRMNLLFERFISAERGEPPDIDVDFEHERREEVIQHIYEKYGRHRAGMVSAVITYRTKSALRDVKKVLGEKRVQEHPEVAAALAQELQGVPRHLSIHSGGFTLSATPIIEIVPVEPARMPGRSIIQWDKEDLQIVGLLKVDILALGMLSALRKTLEQVHPPLTLASIPPEDPKTYEMIRRAETVGVFQIESRAQMSMLKRLLPETFYDLVVQVAIVRPGPIQGQMVHPYLRRRRGLQSAESPDPRLEPILNRTLGVPLFQEQIMKIAMVMADFTPGEADQLRRAIGAWKSTGSVDSIGRRLMQGLLRKGLSEQFVQQIFQQIQGFAEYGFPESHAASFALLAYASAYLKCHYPAQFTCALLNSQPMGFYSSSTLVEEVKRQRVRVFSVHPNDSEWDCTVHQGSVQLGWRMLQGLTQAQGEGIVQARRLRAFESLLDFVLRTNLSVRLLNRLAWGNAFSCFGLTQRQALWEILSLRGLRNQGESNFQRPEFKEVQLSLFPFFRSNHNSSFLPFQPLSPYEAISSDHEAYQLSVQGHPMWALRQEPSWRRKLPKTTTQSFRQAVSSSWVSLAGLIIIRQRPPSAKGTMFATLEDEWGFADLIFSLQVFEKYRVLLETTAFLRVHGFVQRSENLRSLQVRKASPLFEEEEQSCDFASLSMPSC
ncbi:MAG: PHP domain-containing protein [Bdellovibrionia bacterium]